MTDTTGPLAAAPAPVLVDPRQWMSKVAIALIAAYVTLLAAALVKGAWLEDGSGRTIQTDFVNVWAAGHLVLEGRGVDAYNWLTHKAVEEQAVGHPFDRYFPWPYPPPYLLVAAGLALLPYTAAFLFWNLLTFPLYAFALRRIVGRPLGFLLAGAFPGALWNVWTGQNGFVTAALLGSTLGAMERAPRLAGILLGLLSYKPQFGILFPVVLIAGGHWRVFSYAVAVAAAMIAVSQLVFGAAAWQAFFAYLPLTGRLVFGEGLAGYHKLQTAFGVVRVCGGGEATAWSLHIGFAALVALGVWWLWRRRVAFEIKAAALGAAVLVATPYLYVYDLVVLAVPMAFLAGIGLRDGFLSGELAAFAAAAALVFVAPLVGLPTGFLAIMLLLVLICRRAVFALRDTSC